MRISDWSSDVCSSDLSGRAGDERADLVDPGGTGCLIRGLEVQSDQRLGVRCPQVEPPLPAVDGEAVEAILGISGIRGGHLLDDSEAVGTPEVALARRGVAAMGCASGGGRVCKSVWVWVDAESLKTKNEQTIK